MKSAFEFFAAGIALFLTSATARGEFETWKNKDGKAAELELDGVDEGAAGTQVRFLTKADKEVTLKLEDLAAEDQARVKEWQKLPPLKASFSHVKTRADANFPSLRFVFDLKGGIALPSHPVKLSNIKARVGETELEVKQWTSIVDDGSFSEDAATKGAVNARRKWTLVITAEGDFSGLEVEACEFSADVEVACGKSPKEVSAMFPLPKGEDTEENVEKILDPLSVTVGTLYGADFRSSDGRILSGRRTCFGWRERCRPHHLCNIFAETGKTSESRVCSLRFSR